MSEDFDEGKHPRGKGGKFSHTAGEGAGDGGDAGSGSGDADKLTRRRKLVQDNANRVNDAGDEVRRNFPVAEHATDAVHNQAQVEVEREIERLGREHDAHDGDEGLKGAADYAHQDARRGGKSMAESHEAAMSAIEGAKARRAEDAARLGRALAARDAGAVPQIDPGITEEYDRAVKGPHEELDSAAASLEESQRAAVSALRDMDALGTSDTAAPELIGDDDRPDYGDAVEGFGNASEALSRTDDDYHNYDDIESSIAAGEGLDPPEDEDGNPLEIDDEGDAVEWSPSAPTDDSLMLISDPDNEADNHGVIPWDGESNSDYEERALGSSEAADTLGELGLPDGHADFANLDYDEDGKPLPYDESNQGGMIDLSREDYDKLAGAHDKLLSDAKERYAADLAAHVETQKAAEAAHGRLAEQWEERKAARVQAFEDKAREAHAALQKVHERQLAAIETMKTAGAKIDAAGEAASSEFDTIDEEVDDQALGEMVSGIDAMQGKAFRDGAFEDPEAQGILDGAREAFGDDLEEERGRTSGGKSRAGEDEIATMRDAAKATAKVIKSLDKYTKPRKTKAPAKTRAKKGFRPGAHAGSSVVPVTGPPKHKLKLTKLDYLSLVDRPAQETAGIRLIKRADGAVGAERDGTIQIYKVGDGPDPLIYCWAFTCTDKDGAAYHDLQGDAVAPDFVKAAEAFMQSGGAVDEMHDANATSRVAFAFPWDADIATAMLGPEVGAATKVSGLMTAIRPTPEQLAKARAGDYTGVSIAGTGLREIMKAFGRDPGPVDGEEPPVVDGQTADDDGEEDGGEGLEEDLGDDGEEVTGDELASLDDLAAEYGIDPAELEETIEGGDDASDDDDEAGEGLAEKAFDESKHPRIKGRFSSSAGGATAGAPAAGGAGRRSAAGKAPAAGAGAKKPAAADAGKKLSPAARAVATGKVRVAAHADKLRSARGDRKVAAADLKVKLSAAKAADAKAKKQPTAENKRAAKTAVTAAARAGKAVDRHEAAIERHSTNHAAAKEKLVAARAKAKGAGVPAKPAAAAKPAASTDAVRPARPIEPDKPTKPVAAAPTEHAKPAEHKPAAADAPKADASARRARVSMPGKKPASPAVTAAAKDPAKPAAAKPATDAKHSDDDLEGALARGMDAVPNEKKWGYSAPSADGRGFSNEGKVFISDAYDHMRDEDKAKFGGSLDSFKEHVHRLQTGGRGNVYQSRLDVVGAAHAEGLADKVKASENSKRGGRGTDVYHFVHRVKKGIDTMQRRIAKRVILTDSVNGHQHAIDLDDPADCWRNSLATSHQVSIGTSDPHAHAWIFDPQSGAITIAEDSGHTHAVAEAVPPEVLADAAAKRECPVCHMRPEPGDKYCRSCGAALKGEQGAAAPAPAIVPEPVVDETDVLDGPAPGDEELNKRNSPPRGGATTVRKQERGMTTDQQLIANLRKSLYAALALPEAQRLHVAKLAPAEQESFLALDASGRDGIMKRADEADPEIYKTADGMSIRKSHGQIAADLAKRLDSQAVELKKQADEVALAKAATAAVELRKRADVTIGHFGGSGDARAALLGAVEGIADEATRKSATVILKGADAAMEQNGKPYGAAGDASPDDEEDDPEKKLEALAQKRATDEKVTVAKAMTRLLDTPEGAALYSKSQDRKRLRSV